MLLSDFDYQLPPELIAQEPALPRDSARLLVYTRATDSMQHATVSELPRFLAPETTLVANNSRVRHSRLFGVMDHRQVEVLVVEPLRKEGTYRCLLRGKHLKPNGNIQIVTANGGAVFAPLSATILRAEEVPGMNTYVLEFVGKKNVPIEDLLKEYAVLPLPPYISNSTAEPERYQTVFAKETGSAAAPTAGLHFTPELLETLKSAGHAWKEVTLHVGLGTFLPLRNEEVTANTLHSELTSVSQETAEYLQEAREAKRPILAVGTTSTRTLESNSLSAEIRWGTDTTNTFIYPGYRFKTVTNLLTNFHLPKSSLLLLVAAFIGNTQELDAPELSEEEMIRRLHRIYAEAIKERYRFFSFGDAMLIL